MEHYIDLHMHSMYSDDGEFPPVELVRMCQQTGIRMMAISDHNCVKANEEALKEANRLNIQYIPAIELDCTYQSVDLHLLGYWINHKSLDFERVEYNIRTQEAEASQERLKLTRMLGLDVTEDELTAISGKGYWKDAWTGEVFAEVLLHKPEYAGHEMLHPYRVGGLRSDNPYVNFYWDFYAQGKPCYVKTMYPSLKDGISLIKDNGGKAVLAHPGINLQNRYDLFDEMVTLGIDGVEAFSSYHDEPSAKHFHGAARKHSLLTTCGSDFHGKTKPAIRLGESGCFVGQHEIERQLLDAKKQETLEDLSSPKNQAAAKRSHSEVEKRESCGFVGLQRRGGKRAFRLAEVLRSKVAKPAASS